MPLADSDAVSIGFVDFDPNSFINLNDNAVLVLTKPLIPVAR
ncbi:Solitary outer membrane autotransporter beta-barrel domain [Vibrio lentus]|nr:Solitary outer membrane autotransporter beta-barrel domain [Vibrio lentus]